MVINTESVDLLHYELLKAVRNYGLQHFRYGIYSTTYPVESAEYLESINDSYDKICKLLKEFKAA